jgi:hypothetical protein
LHSVSARRGSAEFPVATGLMVQVQFPREPANAQAAGGSEVAKSIREVVHRSFCLLNVATAPQGKWLGNVATFAEPCSFPLEVIHGHG